MEITCTQPGVRGPSRIRVSPAATAAQPAQVRLEIAGGGHYRTALVDGDVEKAEFLKVYDLGIADTVTVAATRQTRPGRCWLARSTNSSPTRPGRTPSTRASGRCG